MRTRACWLRVRIVRPGEEAVEWDFGWRDWSITCRIVLASCICRSCSKDNTGILGIFVSLDVVSDCFFVGGGRYLVMGGVVRRIRWCGLIGSLRYEVCGRDPWSR